MLSLRRFSRLLTQISLKIIIIHRTVTGEHIFCKTEIQDVCIVNKWLLATTVIKDSRVGKMNRKVGTTDRSCRCKIHQEVVCGKVKRMDDILKRVFSLVNFIRAEGLCTLPSWKRNPLIEITNLQIYINNMKVSNGSTSPIHTVLQSQLQKYTVTKKGRIFFYKSTFLLFQMKEFCGCVHGLTWFTLYPMITVLGFWWMLVIALHYRLTFLLQEPFLSAVASSVTKNLLFKIWSLVDVLFMSNSQQEVSVLHFAYIYER